MRRRRRGPLAFLAAVAIAFPTTLLALSFHAAARAPVSSGALAATPAAHDYFELLLAHSRHLGPLPAGRMVTLVLTLQDPTAARRAAALAAMYRPHSPTFGRPISLSAYGPSPHAVARVVSYLRRAGLATHWQRGDAWLRVAGPARQVEATFGVHIHQYVAVTGTRFYASPRDPTVPAALRPLVTGAGHVSNYSDRTSAAVSHAIPAGGLTPNGLLLAYDIKALRDQGIDGAGETVVFGELGETYAQSDFDTFTQKFGLPPMQVTEKATSTGLQPGDETEMDLEVVHAIAPAARLVIYNVRDDQFNEGHMIDENPGAVISESFSGCDKAYSASDASAYADVYLKAVAQKESVFASTGDEGAYECLRALEPQRGTPPATQYLGAAMPASIPQGVTAAGGTRLSVRQDGSWYHEFVWEEPARTGGTGGGVSRHYPVPDYQKGISGVADHRTIPDISADADPATGVSVYLTGSWQEGNGTSQATPIWAGITALINEYLKKKGLPTPGFMNPVLYNLATHNQPYPPFHDVTVGNNLYYAAGPGYDAASGWGTPDVWNLTRDIEAYQRNGSGQ